jgi:hypothetical protein
MFMKVGEIMHVICVGRGLVKRHHAMTTSEFILVSVLMPVTSVQNIIFSRQHCLYIRKVIQALLLMIDAIHKGPYRGRNTEAPPVQRM